MVAEPISFKVYILWEENTRMKLSPLARSKHVNNEITYVACHLWLHYHGAHKSPQSYFKTARHLLGYDHLGSLSKKSLLGRS